MHPLIAHLFGLPLKSYGLMLTLGFAAGIVLACRRAARRGLDPNEIMNMAAIVISAAVVGSRLLYCAVNPSEFAADPMKILFVHQGGLVFIGGLLAAVAAVSWYLIHHRLDYLTWADVMFPSVALGHVFGRLGCFLNGCCYGLPSDAWYCVIFPSIGDGVSHVPTQLFEAGANLVILLLLLFIDRVKPREGYVFASYVTLYSVWRFGIEFVRGDDRGLPVFGLPVSKAISLVGIFVGLAFLAWLRRHPVTQPSRLDVSNPSDPIPVDPDRRMFR